MCLAECLAVPPMLLCRLRCSAAYAAVLLCCCVLLCRPLLFATCCTGRAGKNKSNSRATRGRGTYGLGSQGTCRADGCKTYSKGRKGLGALNPLNQTQKQPRRKHSSKMILQKSAGLARILLQNEKNGISEQRRASVSILNPHHPPWPPSIRSRAVTGSDPNPHCTPQLQQS